MIFRLFILVSGKKLPEYNSPKQGYFKYCINELVKNSQGILLPNIKQLKGVILLGKFIENLDLTARGAWLPYTFGIVLLLFVLFMPKRLSWREIFFVWMTIGLMAWMTDTLVAVQLDLFDMGHPQKRGIGEVINYTIIPPSLSVIFLNFFQSERKWIYAIIFTIISVIYEWGLVQVGNMKLHGWHTWWSIPVYLLMFGVIVPWILRFLRKENADNDGREREFNLNLGREKAR